MSFEQKILLEKFLMDSKQVSKDFHDDKLQLGFIAVKVNVLILSEVFSALDPLIELLKLAVFRILGRNN